jgi:anti-sigma factor RsiW
VTVQVDENDGMTCSELIEFLDAYLAGDLLPEVRGRFEEHLIECRDCLAYLRSYRDTVGLLRDAYRDADEDVPADVPPQLLRAILAARKR